MLESFFNSRKHVLDPMEQISKVLFGLIMVPTFTCSFSAAEADRTQVHKMLLAAAGCNLAPGFIDAVFYLLARFGEQGRGMVALQALRKATDLSEAQAIVAAALPPLLASVFTPTEFDLLRQRLNLLPEPPARSRLTKKDWLAIG